MRHSRSITAVKLKNVVEPLQSAIIHHLSKNSQEAIRTETPEEKIRNFTFPLAAALDMERISVLQLQDPIVKAEQNKRKHRAYPVIDRTHIEHTLDNDVAALVANNKRVNIDPYAHHLAQLAFAMMNATGRHYHDGGIVKIATHKAMQPTNQGVSVVVPSIIGSYLTVSAVS
jgi:hypothetical protein